MANIQVTHDADPSNARSESSVAINPNNPLQVVAASKKFVDIQTYDFTLATEFSSDGGLTWQDSADLAMPGFTVMTDPTLAWDDVGNVYLVGLAGTDPPTWNTIGIMIYKSADGGATWSAPNPIHQSTGDDKQWAAGDGNPASPHHGNVYAVWDNLVAGGGMSFARTTDDGASWVGAGGAPAGGIIQTGTVFPEIDVSETGVVFVASIGGNQIEMIVSADGGNSFQPTTPPANGVTTLEATLPIVDGWPEFPGGSFRVITDPTVCAYGSTVVVAWADNREGASRIYYARSLDGGASWATGPSGQPLLTTTLPANFQHFHPQITKDPNGAFGCAFYEFGPKPARMLIDVLLARSFDGGATFSYVTVTDQPWDPSVDAPWAHGDPKVTFIGDYLGLSASQNGFEPVWTDTRTGIQELWTDIVSGTELRTGNSALIESSFRASAANPGNFEALVLEGNSLVHYWRDNSTAGFPWNRTVVVSAHATGPACLIESSFRASAANPGNFEALVLEGNNLVHYWRDNSTAGFPWNRTVVVSAQASGPACLIESSFRASAANPGNFDALVLEGNNLVHYWRDNSTAGFPWNRTVVVSAQASGPACLIESSFRASAANPGNFEALVLEGNSLVHYWRDNSTAGFPWNRTVVVSAHATGPACLIESSFRASAANPGNFEALVSEGSDLVHYWRDNSTAGFPWNRTVVVSAHATGPACLIESSFRASAANPGNFESLTNEFSDVRHYWRDNSVPGFPWNRGVALV